MRQRLTCGVKGSSGGEIHRLCVLAADSVRDPVDGRVTTRTDFSASFDFDFGNSVSDGDEDRGSPHEASSGSSDEGEDPWTAAEIMMFDKARLVTQDDGCAIAQMVQSKPCWRPRRSL